MLKVLYLLFTIRFRKYFTKGDSFAFCIILLFYILSAVIIHFKYNDIKNYIYILLIETILNHRNRKDIDFLKLNKNNKLILFLEYFIYHIPFYIVFLMNNDFKTFFSFIIFKIIIVNLPKIQYKSIRYPFNLLNPFWHINFRKYHLLLIYPFLFLLLYIGIKFANDNMIYFVLILLSLITCLPTFEREKNEEILISGYSSEDYLNEQFKNSIINTFYIIFPFIVLIVLFYKLEILIILLLVFLIPIINQIFKYIYFDNPTLHQIVLILFIGSSVLFYGLPLISLVYFRNRSVKNLKSMKYA